jgi:1-acyl-sn-glycerol-3-phosphate acyltransferase
VRPPPLIIRRAIIDPLWIPLSLLFVVVLAVLAVAGLLAAPFDRRLRLTRLALAAAAYCVVDAVLVVCCAALWLRSPVPTRRPASWLDAHERLLRRALVVLLAVARPLLGFRVELEDVPDRAALAGRPLLVLARHGGPGDSLAIAEVLLSVYRRRPVVVLKDVLRFDPALDILLTRLPSCFVPGRRGQDLLAQLTDLAGQVGPADAILIFPEGRNWTPGRYRRALARLRERGWRRDAAKAAANPHVLPPQPAGVLACLAARPDLDVVVVAHTGLDDLVSPGQIWRALPVGDRPMIMRWWHHSAAQLPAEPERRKDWLYLQWAFVDSWIDVRKGAASPGPAPDHEQGDVVPG